MNPSVDQEAAARELHQAARRAQEAGVPFLTMMAAFDQGSIVLILRAFHFVSFRWSRSHGLTDQQFF